MPQRLFRESEHGPRLFLLAMYKSAGIMHRGVMLRISDDLFGQDEISPISSAISRYAVRLTVVVARRRIWRINYSTDACRAGRYVRYAAQEGTMGGNTNRIGRRRGPPAGVRIQPGGDPGDDGENPTYGAIEGYRTSG